MFLWVSSGINHLEQHLNKHDTHPLHIPGNREVIGP